MRHIIIGFLLALGLSAPALAMGHGAKQAGLHVHGSKLMLGIGARPAAIFGHVMNKSGAAKRLVAADSPAFERIELHTHEIDPNGMMRMLKVDGFDVPIKGGLKLARGGHHLMAFGFNGAAGDDVSVTLRFADDSTIEFRVTATARAKHGGHKKPSQGKMGHHGH